MKVGINREQLSDENNDNNNTLFTIATPAASVIIVVVIIIAIFIAVCVMRKKQKNRRYVCMYIKCIKINVDRVDHSYRIGNILAMEKQSKTNSTIYENVKTDKTEIEKSENPNSVHTYEAFKQLSVEQMKAFMRMLKRMK